MKVAHTNVDNSQVTARPLRHRLALVALVVGLLGAVMAASPANSAPLVTGETVVAGEDFEIAGGDSAGDVPFATWAGTPDVATNPFGETLFVSDVVSNDENGEDDPTSYGKLGRIVGQDGQIGDEFMIGADCPNHNFFYEPVSATWNSTNGEWLVVWPVEDTTLEILDACPIEGDWELNEEPPVLVGQIVGRDGVLRGTNFVISETFDGSPSSEDNRWDDIEHIHARWSPVASAYLVSWKAYVQADTAISQRVWATAIDAEGLSLTGGQAEDVSGDSGTDNGVSVAYSETSDVFITVFGVDDNNELPGARLMELVRDGSGVSINFTTSVFNLHLLETDGDGNRGGSGAPTVAWDSSRDEVGVRWRAEDLDGNRNQQLFNVVGADGSYSDAGIVKILSAEEFSNGGRVGVAYDDVADEWVLVLTVKPDEGSSNEDDELGMARSDAAARSGVTPTILEVGSNSVARPNIAYLGDGCSVYTWWEFGEEWGAGDNTEAVWAHIECFFAPTGSVVFDPNTGTGGPDAITSDGGSSVTIPQTLPSLDGYTFIGWNTAVDGSGDSYTGDDAYTLPDTGTATLYAQWQQVGCDSTDVLGSTVFTDVATGSYYDESTGWMHTDGITTGTTLTTFDPDRAATRAEVITFLWRDEGSPSSTLGSSIFSDVTPGSYSNQAIGWASETGVTTGTTLTTFDPDRAATRGEVAAFFGRLNGCE